MQIEIILDVSGNRKTEVCIGVSEAVSFIKSLPRGKVGDKMQLKVDGRSTAYADAPRWYIGQYFAGNCDYNVPVLLSAESINFVYNSTSPIHEVIKMANAWAYVNGSKRTHRLNTDGSYINLEYAEVVIATDCKVYPGHPYGLSYNGKDYAFFETFRQLAASLVAHDIELLE